MADSSEPSIQVLVQVPLDQANDLAALRQGVGSLLEITTAHPFDGETVAQILISLSGASFPFFRVWVKARATARKEFKVVADGVELSGYTADEASAILDRLQTNIDNAEK